MVKIGAGTIPVSFGMCNLKGESFRPPDGTNFLEWVSDPSLADLYKAQVLFLGPFLCWRDGHLPGGLIIWGPVFFTPFIDPGLKFFGVRNALCKLRFHMLLWTQKSHSN